MCFLLLFYFAQSQHLSAARSEEAKEAAMGYLRYLDFSFEESVMPKKRTKMTMLEKEGLMEYYQERQKVIRHGDAAIQPMMEMIHDKKAYYEKAGVDLREGFILVLFYIKTQKAKEALKRLMLNKELSIRMRERGGDFWILLASVEELRRLIKKEASMKEKDPIILYHCAMGLANHGDASNLPYIFLALEDPEGKLIKTTVSRVWNYGSQVLSYAAMTPKKPLTGAVISDKCWETLENVCKGIIPLPSEKDRIIPMEVKKDRIIFRWDKSSHRPVSAIRYLARLLGNIVDERSVKLLGHLVKHPDPKIRDIALRSLERHSGEDALRILRQVAAHDPDKAVRAFAENQLDVKEGRPPRRAIVFKTE